jgi:hypothetical protein
MGSEIVQVAVDPAVYENGTDSDGLFLSENVVLTASLSPSATSYVSQKLPGGRYWVLIVGRDTELCVTPGTSGCHEVSAPVAVDVPRDPPVIATAGFDATGRFTATWTLPRDMANDYIELATNPVVYASGDRAGEFLDQNVVHSGFTWDYQTSYTSSEPIPTKPGDYYVHVASFVPQSCDVAGFCDIYEYSDPYRINIPGPPPPAPPPVTADTLTAFAALRAPVRQSIRSLYVRATMAEPGTVTATGTISVPGAARVFRLRSATAAAEPGVAVRLRLRASQRALRAVRRALRRHRRVTARISITARDAAGNTKSDVRTVRLRR